MKKTIKMHPLMFFTLLKPYLLLGIIPSIYSLLSLFGLGLDINFYFYQLLLFSGLAILIEIKRKCLKIELFEDYLIVKKGIYFKSESKLSKNKITALYIKQNPIERLFSAKTVFINTMSDGKKSCEFKFVINKEAAKELKEAINEKSDFEKRKIPFLKVVLWAAASGGAFEGVLLFTPIVRNASKLLGIKLYDTFLSQITDKLKVSDKYLPTTVNIITAIFIFIYLVGFLYELLKNLKMWLKFSKKSISVESGIIVKRKTVLNTQREIGFCTEQTIFMRILRRQGLKAVTGGYIGKFSGAALISPFQTDDELINSLKILFNSYNPPKKYIEKTKARLGAFSALLLPFFISVSLIAAGIVLISLFDKFKRFIIFTLIVVQILVLLYGYILLYGYKKSRISFENKITIDGTRRFKIKRQFFKNDGIAKIKLRQNPFDRKRGSCKAIITVYSKGGEKTTVRWINKRELMKNLENIE